MSATTITEEMNNETIENDLEDSKSQEEAPKMDLDKLAALKAKSKGNMSNKIVATKPKAIKMAAIGTGQAGSKLAEAFYKCGYPAIAINTAIQDLAGIQINDSNKLLLEYSLGGAAKDLSIGAGAAESNIDAINEIISEKTKESQVNLLCTSLGGGSGAGSIDTLIQVLGNQEKPIVVIAVMPMASEDAQTKSNALETLAKLAGYAQNKVIANLIVLDNSRIEVLFSDTNQMDFYDVANKAIVETLDNINMYAAQPSKLKALDPMEFSKVLLDGEGLTVYGEVIVQNYESDTAIAEAVINNVSANLLAEGFDLKTSKYVGFIVSANAETWKKIPASSINYAMEMINDTTGGGATAVFKGVYVDEHVTDVKIISIFSGLGLPTSRVNDLKSEVLELQSKVKVKNTDRNLTLELSTSTNNTVSAAQKIKDKITAKSSTFGKFLSNVVDKRK